MCLGYRARLALAAALAALLPVPAVASIERPVGPYTVVTSDQRFVFVMARRCHFGESRPEPIEGYTESGLYRNDGSRTPLWTVDWCDSVWLPSDGVHLVRSPGRTSLYGGEAVSFFSRGRLLRTYGVGELVGFTWLLPESSAGLQWRRSIELQGGARVYPLVTPWSEPETIPEPTMRGQATHLGLETVQGDRFVFLLETGEIVSSHRPLRSAAAGGAAILALAWIAHVVVASRRRGRSSGARFLCFLHRSLAAGWALAAVPMSAGLVLIGLDLAAGDGLGGGLAEHLWRFFVRVPYVRTTLLFGGMPQLQMDVPNLLMVWGFWAAVSGVLLAGTMLAVRTLAALRGGPVQPEERGPGPALLVRQILALVGVGTLSFVLLDGARIAARRPVSVVLAGATVAGPATLLLLQRRARRA